MAKLTKKKAKEICVRFWKHMAENPHIRFKGGSPLFSEVKDFENGCPLCQYHYVCEDCVLGGRVACLDFVSWSRAETDEDRAKYAWSIVGKVKAW